MLCHLQCISRSFNPRSHEGSDVFISYIRVGIKVSIHAPTRGATAIEQLQTVEDVVSIHAPTRGATYPQIPRIRHRRKFQSTLPRGERPSAGGCCCRGRCFNPRSHEGSDPGITILVCRRLGFNPRSHEGSDCSTHTVRSHLLCFNPRSHEGSDLFHRSCQILIFKFQSTLPRGERLLILRMTNLFNSFNPRSHEGSDVTLTNHISDFLSFNPRSHEGSDHRLRCMIRFLRLFQSTLPRGERLS